MSAIDHADALSWLDGLESGTVKAALYDPPYAVGTPVRGKDDGAAGAVFGPLSFMSQTLAKISTALMPGGVCAIFADWRRIHDLGYIASTVGLRASACVAWTRKRPGTGGLFRSSWDPILIVSRGIPAALDRAAVRNVIETDDFDMEVVEADYPTRRRHPYEKPAAVYQHILKRCCNPGDIVIDPFAGSGVSRHVAEEMGLRWRGCDIDPEFAGKRLSFQSDLPDIKEPTPRAAITPTPDTGTAEVAAPVPQPIRDNSNSNGGAS